MGCPCIQAFRSVNNAYMPVCLTERERARRGRGEGEGEREGGKHTDTNTNTLRVWLSERERVEGTEGRE